MLKGKLRLRQVTRLMDNGHQTPILTRGGICPRRKWPIECLIAGDRRTSSNTCARNTRWMRWPSMPRCPTIPPAKFPTRPGLRWTPNSAKLTPGWIDCQAEYGLEALTNLEQQRRTMRGLQNRARKAGPENLERLAAHPATGETSRGRAPASSGPSSDRRTGRQTGPGTKAPDQPDQNGGLPSRKRSAPISCASLPQSGRRGHEP